MLESVRESCNDVDVLNDSSAGQDSDSDGFEQVPSPTHLISVGVVS